MSARASSPATDLATTVVFAAFLAVLGLFPGVYVGATGVPIVVQNMGPFLAGVLIGAKRAVFAVVLFLALVAIGLPLLSGGRGGLAPFVGPSGGFLLGWILSALVSGLIAQAAARRGRPGFPVLLLAAFAGLVADYVIGVPWLAVYTGSWSTALTGSLVFVPGDLVKVVVAALIASVVHRALPGRLVGTRTR
ncbi:biotin transporter BioY [Pseudonocardia sp. RS11V-5]|uniref:biotin transporter BioY n=1 Tax=Pseudonocardia terrae TaxID=2905831 RepID=UPI001E3ACC14|nr:biotin transporter BioY [Pseudonocardia terrae]MCE3549947.1 biotin transporter BioY [Pseudonocardia terrae]